MTVERVGYGAGTADPAGRPNVVQVIVGTAVEPSATPAPGREAVQLEVNVDDVTGEVLAHTIAALLTAGAHDAWATPIVMKKGRPAHTVAALARPGRRRAARRRAARRDRQPRHPCDDRASDGRNGATRSRSTSAATRCASRSRAGRAKPEHDDAVAAATALGRPLRDVLRDAETAARREPPAQ